jgi:ABC-type multidrug transport system ATPase subunit
MECCEACKARPSNYSDQYYSISTSNDFWNENLLLSVSLTILDFLFSAHSMEEAEYLCDRLGIFVSGGLQCVGNPKEVTMRRLMFVFA